MQKFKIMLRRLLTSSVFAGMVACLPSRMCCSILWAALWVILHFAGDSVWVKCRFGLSHVESNENLIWLNVSQCKFDLSQMQIGLDSVWVKPHLQLTQFDSVWVKCRFGLTNFEANANLTWLSLSQMQIGLDSVWVKPNLELTQFESIGNLIWRNFVMMMACLLSQMCT